MLEKNECDLEEMVVMLKAVWDCKLLSQRIVWEREPSRACWEL